VRDYGANSFFQLAAGTFLIMALIALNDPSTLYKDADNVELNLSLAFILVIILFGIRRSIRILQNSN
jgi:hypothetical protein